MPDSLREQWKTNRWKDERGNWTAPAKTFFVIASVLVLMTFIGSFLPDAPVSSTVTEESTRGYSSPDREVGTWRVTYQGVRITTTIRQEQGSYYMEQHLVFRGSGDRNEQRLSKQGDRYYLNSNEYFEIDTGYLDAYDEAGFIWAARPVR